MSYLCFFVSVVYSALQYVLIIWVLLYNMTGVLEAGTTYTLQEHLCSPMVFDGVCFAHLSIFCVVLLCFFTIWVPCVVMSVTISTSNRCSVRLYLQMFVGELVSYLRYLCLFTYSCVQHIYVLCFCFV